MSKTPRLGMGPLPSISEVSQQRSTCNQLRREVEALKKQLHGETTQLEATCNQLRQSELARATSDEYARKLEQVLMRVVRAAHGLLRMACHSLHGR